MATLQVRDSRLNSEIFGNSLAEITDKFSHLREGVPNN